jgi:hypothetical protein
MNENEFGGIVIDYTQVLWKDNISRIVNTKLK